MTSLPTQQDVPETPALAGVSSQLRGPQICPIEGSRLLTELPLMAVAGWGLARLTGVPGTW